MNHNIFPLCLDSEGRFLKLPGRPSSVECSMKRPRNSSTSAAEKSVILSENRLSTHDDMT